MIEIEKMGKPGVAIVSGRFHTDAEASSRAFGMPDLQWVVVPRIYRNLEHELCISQTEDAIHDLQAALTSSIDERPDGVNTESTRTYEGDDRYDAVIKMNNEFIREDLGDGLPLHPATLEAVSKMLSGTCLPKDHVVCDMPPGFGIATVEKSDRTAPKRPKGSQESGVPGPIDEPGEPCHAGAVRPKQSAGKYESMNVHAK